ncbi:MAG: hypothetical protein RLZZ387_2204 [Chloroflexota bacterium]|jgi:hypothetical protein
MLRYITEHLGFLGSHTQLPGAFGLGRRAFRVSPQRRVSVTADHTKLGRVSAALVALVTAMHTLVTASDVPAGIVTAIREQGVAVVRG